MAGIELTLTDDEVVALKKALQAIAVLYMDQNSAWDRLDMVRLKRVLEKANAGKDASAGTFGAGIREGAKRCAEAIDGVAIQHLPDWLANHILEICDNVADGKTTDPIVQPEGHTRCQACGGINKNNDCFLCSDKERGVEAQL